MPPFATGRLAESWLGAALALTLAVGAGVLLTELMMAPPADELRKMALYLTLSGAGTMLLGWAALRFAGDAAPLSIRARAFVSAAVGSAVALLNVLIVAELMFVSTAHDLELLVALLAFTGIITLCFSMWVATATSARIGRVAAAIRAIHRGDYQARAALRGGDEVAALAAVVNALALRLQEAQRQREAMDREQRDLTAAISHDLRTPLASLRVMVEAMDDGLVTGPEETARYHAAMRREIDRLSRMIDDLFELARMDAGALQLDRRPTDIREVAAEVVDSMQPQAQRRGIALRFEAAPSFPDLPIDGARMERAITNLVRNALEHTPAGGSVSVSVARRGDQAVVLVADNGEGVEPDDIERLWDRFYRADPSRNRSLSDDGAGLGLAIVRGIVQAHGGSVDCASVPGSGATFSLRLPIGAAQTS
jgi:signal transduction histidine kinase